MLQCTIVVVQYCHNKISAAMHNRMQCNSSMTRSVVHHSVVAAAVVVLQLYVDYSASLVMTIHRSTYVVQYYTLWH